MSLDTFLAQLISYESHNVFNPWAEACIHDTVAYPFICRQKRLKQHLSNKEAQFILIGEAPGYQGCRYSGIPFTSERLLLQNMIPNISTTPPFTDNPKGMNEPSATILWNALRTYKAEKNVIMWNAFAWHPMRDGVWTNRTPTTRERRDGLCVLQSFVDLFDLPILTVGKTAEKSLRDIGKEPVAILRHPAYGGANICREGLRSYLKIK